MIFAIITESEQESMLFATKLLANTGQEVLDARPDYMATQDYVFLCMTASRVEFQSHNMTADLVWLSRGAYQTVQDDPIRTDAIFDLSRFGGITIIVNDSAETPGEDHQEDTCPD